MEAREQYTKDYEAHLREWSARVDALSSRVASLEAQARIDLQERVDAAHARLSAANAELRHVAAAPNDRWADVKSGAEHARRSLEAAVLSAQEAVGVGADPAHPLDWAHVREALRRDWEQTRHDLGLKWSQDLNQNLGDTIAQAARVDPIPGRHVANEASAWSDEAAMRFGYACARSQKYYLQNEWDAAFEASLKADWHALATSREWPEVRLAVRYGWARGKTAPEGVQTFHALAI